MIPRVRWDGGNADSMSIPIEEKPKGRPTGTIKFELQGLGERSGVEYLPFVPDKNLSYYLDQLKIKHLIYRSRILDLKYPDNGRRRLGYIPQPDSHIIILPAGVGIAQQFQRSSVDAQELARNMGKGVSVVETNTQYQRSDK